MNLNETFDTYRNEPCDIYLTDVIKDSQNLIFSIVINIVKHNQDAEDLTQEILIKVIQNINMLPQNTNFIGWLSKTSMNAAINLYHQKKRLGALKSDYQKAQIENSAIKEDETISVIYQHLSKLEDTEQSLLINKHMHQMTFDQLSNLYKLPVSTIRTKIDSGLKKLRFSIEKAGFASVALALVPALEELKATEISIDLLPKVKDHFPKTFQKSSGTYSKPISKPLILGATVLTFLVFFVGITIFNQQNITKTNLIEKEFKKSNTLPITKADDSSTKKPLLNKEKQIANSTEENDSQNEVKSLIPLPQPVEIQKVTVSSDFAGQLLDSITKEPIADAKLEIWDIYTYEKHETKTDSEGKYSVPESLDKTFFYYLKFIKDDYVVKQTFQHFKIHKNISVFMGKGKKITCKINFNGSANGIIYLGSHFGLKSEQHLSNNQKQNLQKIFDCLLVNAPIEVYSFGTIKLQNTNNYALKMSVIETPPSDFFCRYPDFNSYNFGLWYEDGIKLGSLGIQDGNASTSSYHSENKYALTFMNTGKPVPVKDLKVLDKRTNKERINHINQENKRLDEYDGELFNCLLTVKNSEYYSQLNGRNFGLPKGQLASIYLVPYSNVIFEPLSLSSKYNNVQVLIGSNAFSKKSVFKKVPNSSGDLIVYDDTFEEKLLDIGIETPIGGSIDINSELNSSEKNCKNITISITLNDKPLKDTNIAIALKENETSKFSSSRQAQLDQLGSSIIKISTSVSILSLYFQVNNIYYRKEIDLLKIINDNISLNLNKLLTIQPSKEVLDSYEKAKQIKIGYEDPYYNRKGGQLKIYNDNFSATVPITEQSIFVEKDSDYFISDPGYSIKTIFNQLKAIQPTEIKSHQDKVDLKIVSELDYTTVLVEILDNNGNEIKTLNWSIQENGGNAMYSRADGYVCRIEFFNPDERIFTSNGRNIGKEISVGHEALKSKTIQLLNNRKYSLIVNVEGYVDYLELFSTSDGGTLNKKVILKKPNSIRYKEDKTKEINEIMKALKDGDIIYEYNGVRILNKNTFKKSHLECNLENAQIKLIRDNKSISMAVPSFQIFGIENFYYDDKNGLLKNESQTPDEK